MNLPLATAIVAAVLLAGCTRGPSTFDDCIWKAVSLPTERGVLAAHRYCNQKFKAEYDALRGSQQQEYTPIPEQKDR